MLFDDLIFLFGKLTFFVYYAVGDTDLSDIMKERGIIDPPAFFLTLSHISCYLLGILRNP